MSPTSTEPTADAGAAPSAWRRRLLSALQVVGVVVLVGVWLAQALLINVKDSGAGLAHGQPTIPWWIWCQEQMP